MIAHIKDGKVVNTYHEPKGRVTFENGLTVSPPTVGTYGVEQIVPVVEVTIDNSTGTSKRRATVVTVEADRVLRTVTISDVPIEDIRAGASLDLIDFINALVGAGILPPAEAIDAAKGNWPATFSAALAGMPDAQKVAAQIEWAAVQRIRRNHPLIAMLAAAANLTEAQVDALFGIV
tara:strand:+ start:70 stop:600 length:531 start_codon:yes stop_codon:yes gene_type:complete